MTRALWLAALLLAAPVAPAAEISPGTIDPGPSNPGTVIPGTVVQDPRSLSDNPLPEAGIKGRKLEWPVQTVVPFEEDRQQLDDAARAVLRRQADWLKTNPQARILVVAYLNGEGTREYLLGLSLKMAETVKDALMAQGIDGRRVATLGYGKEKPPECGADIRGRPVRVCTVSLPYAAD